MPIFAFFDLDRTVFSINSGFAWLAYERRAGRISPRKFAKGLLALARYTIGQSDLEPVILEAIKDYEGLPEAVLRERTQDFYRRHVAHTIRVNARATIRRHQAEGHRCLTLTTSTHYLADLVVQELALDGALCTRLEAVHGHLTGRPEGRICYGSGKLELMTQHLLQHGGHLADTYFYTDSYSDHAALGAVGHPVVVCPDLRLMRSARRSGWPVERW